MSSAAETSTFSSAPLIDDKVILSICVILRGNTRCWPSLQPTSRLRAVTAVLLLCGWLLLLPRVATEQTAPPSFQNGLCGTNGAVGRTWSLALRAGAVAVLTSVARSLGGGEDRGGEKGGPHVQTYINSYKHDSRFIFASNNAKHPLFHPKRGRFLNDALPLSPNRYYASTCQFKSFASKQKPWDLFWNGATVILRLLLVQ